MPIPFFAYGTLRPGESRWSAIVDCINDTEPAEVVGRRFDTGLGFPGLVLDGSGPVDGVLLHPHRATHHALRERLDAIEGHPHLYTRTLVRLVDGRVAWIYAWKGSPNGPQ